MPGVFGAWLVPRRIGVLSTVVMLLMTTDIKVVMLELQPGELPADANGTTAPVQGVM